MNINVYVECVYSICISVSQCVCVSPMKNLGIARHAISTALLFHRAETQSDLCVPALQAPNPQRDRTQREIGMLKLDSKVHPYRWAQNILLDL